MGERFFKLPQALAARRDLTPAAKIVFAAIVDRIGGNGLCWPGSRRLATDSGLDRGTVLEAVARLAAAGLLLVDKRGNGKVNNYRLPNSESGGEIQPAGKSNRLENPTGSGGKTQPEAAGKPSHNQTDPITRPKRARRKATLPDPRIAVFVRFFCEAFLEVVGRQYVVTGAKDGAIVKRLLKSLSVEQLQQASRNMLADDWARDRADIGLLSTQINRWLGTPGKKSSFTPAKAGTSYEHLVQRFDGGGK